MSGLSRRFTYILPAILALTSGQSIPPRAGTEQRSGSSSLMRFVPDSVHLFISTRQLQAVDDALRRARAWHLVPLIAGRPVSAAHPFELRAGIREFLGPRSSIDVDDLMHCELGFLAKSWEDLGQAVWLVRMPNLRTGDLWFPRAERVPADDALPDRFFQMETGMFVCLREETAALARRTADGSLLQKTARLLLTDGDGVLADSGIFHELSTHLPANPLATAYVDVEERTAESSRTMAALWPTIDRAVVGLYEGGGRIDLAIRGSLESPDPRPPLTASAVSTVLSLPQTTLFAMATGLDREAAARAASGATKQSTFGRYLTLFAGLREPSSGETKPFPEFGSNVIVVWEQDLSGRGSTPQVAVMLSSPQARDALDEISRIAGNAIKLMGALEQIGEEVPLSVEFDTHLGTPIRFVSFEAYAERSRLPIVRLLRRTQPAWAVIDDWVVFALSRAHIERIIDARNGLIPTLSAVPDVRELSWRKGDRSLISILQAGLAADVLERWLADYRSGSPSLLDPTWWDPAARGEVSKRRQLGIGMKANAEPGAVVVARVYPGTPAEGRLQVDDRIIGLDGYLLDLASPNADLRQLFAESTAVPGPTLRVQRQRTTIEVVLPREKLGDRPWHTLIQPADAVRELASMGRTVQCASFMVLASDEARYSARLSLRFAP